MPMVPLQQLMSKDSYEIIQRAETWCGDLLQRASALLASCPAERRLDPAGVGFVAVGSVGRQEALDAESVCWTGSCSDAFNGFGRL